MASPTSWRPAALVATAFMIVLLGATMPTPLYPALSRQYHFGELTTTLLFGVYPIGVAAALLVAGGWSDQLGRRPLLLGGIALSTASSVLFLVATTMPELYAGRLVSGLSVGVMAGTSTAGIVDLAPADARGRAGLVAAAATLGGLGIGAPVAGVLTEYAPWPLHLTFLVHLVLLALALGCVLAAPEPVRRAARPDLRPRGASVPTSVRTVFLPAAIAGFASFAVVGLFAGISPALLVTVLHRPSQTLSGTVALLFFVSGVVGQVLSARLSSRAAFGTGCAVMATGLVLVGASLPSASLALLLVGGVVSGLGVGATFRAGLVTLTDASPADVRGEVSSAYFVVLYVGIAGPVIGVGALASSVGLVPAGLVFSVLCAALALLAWTLLARPAARPTG